MADDRVLGVRVLDRCNGRDGHWRIPENTDNTNGDRRTRSAGCNYYCRIAAYSQFDYCH